MSGGLKLLKPAANTMAYLKMGIFGDTGSGKTWTAAQVAIGLQRHIKSNKPVAFFDTETGSNFIKPQFDKAGIELLTLNSHALIDLTQVIKEAESNCSILIIDSISHVWEEFTDSYVKKSKQKFIELWDWKPIKADWRTNYTGPFINSKLHIIMCGRQSGIYEDIEIEQGGKIKKKSVRVGDKMKAESEVGYEPSLLCQMEKVFIENSGFYVRRCNVIKERFSVIDSKEFDNPTFKDFLPHIQMLNIGGEHQGVDTSRNSDALFQDPDYSYQENRKQKEIALEELQQELILMGYAGTSGDVQKKRTELMMELFGTSSKTAIENLHLEKIKYGLGKIKEKRLAMNQPPAEFLRAVNE